MLLSKQIFFFLIVVCLTIGAEAQSLIGAWETTTTSDSGVKLKNIVIFSEGFQVSTWFHAETGKFVKTNGGSWSLEGQMITETVEFDTEDPERVGSTVSFKVEVNENVLRAPEYSMEWTLIDAGGPGELQGAWLMSGRVRDGKTQTRDLNRPRKTMKILSGTRFQWIAYNTETKKFSGTGGGTYTTVDSKYTENIEFFSRDDTKAGLRLEFDYALEDGKWNHKGFSSKGDPMHEIWSRRD
ncbi:MAG: membrane or secreted protein [Bacteroidia bacterium]|nr:membrane or secreted protein [Bacteroidia bacterium]